LTDAPPIRRPRPALRAAGAVASFYFLGFLLSAILLLPLARRLTTGISPADLAAHPTPLFALIQGLLLLASFSAATCTFNSPGAAGLEEAPPAGRAEEERFLAV